MCSANPSAILFGKGLVSFFLPFLIKVPCVGISLLCAARSAHGVPFTGLQCYFPCHFLKHFLFFFLSPFSSLSGLGQIFTKFSCHSFFFFFNLEELLKQVITFFFREILATGRPCLTNMKRYILPNTAITHGGTHR